MKVFCIGLDTPILQMFGQHGFVTMKADLMSTGDELVSYVQANEQILAIVCDFRNTPIPMSVITQLRSHGIDMPFLGISDYNPQGIAWAHTRAEFLEQGGDDLINSRSGNAREITASLRAVCRRVKLATMNFYEFQSEGDTIQMNLDTKAFKVNGVLIHLPPKEFDILALLASRPNYVFTKEAMMESLYGDQEKFPMVKILDVFICKMRKKIDAITGKEDSFIETVWGRGYRLKAGDNIIDLSLPAAA